MTVELVRFTGPDKLRTRLDDMTWPSRNLGNLEWELRYGSKEQAVARRMTCAAVVEAYQALIDMPQARRNAICSALKQQP